MATKKLSLKRICLKLMIVEGDIVRTNDNPPLIGIVTDVMRLDTGTFVQLRVNGIKRKV